MALTNHKVRHVKITPEKYSNLTMKDPYTIYYTTDGVIYVGDKIYSTQFKLFDDNSIPMYGEEGYIYSNIDSKELMVWRGGKWITLIPKISSSVNLVNPTQSKDKDNELVTAKVLRETIISAVEQGLIAGGYDGPMANVPAGVVRTSHQINIVDQKIGRYKPGDVIPKGTGIEDILKNIFTRVIDVEYRTPSIKLSPVNIRVEAGTSTKFVFKFLYDKGDGGDVESVLFMKGVNNVYGDPIMFSKNMVREYALPEPLVITDSDLLQYKVVVKYKDGAVRSNNIGEEVTDGVIKAGQTEDICNCVGERFTWYQSSPIANIPYEKSSEVRGLTNKILGVKKGATFTIDVSKGDKQVIIAYPKILGELENVKSRTLSMHIRENFKPSIVMVEGANGYRSIEYYVYKYTPDTPFSSNDVFDVTI